MSFIGLLGIILILAGLFDIFLIYPNSGNNETILYGGFSLLGVGVILLAIALVTKK